MRSVGARGAALAIALAGLSPFCFSATADEYQEPDRLPLIVLEPAAARNIVFRDVPDRGRVEPASDTDGPTATELLLAPPGTEFLPAPAIGEPAPVPSAPGNPVLSPPAGGRSASELFSAPGPSVLVPGPLPGAPRPDYSAALRSDAWGAPPIPAAPAAHPTDRFDAAVFVPRWSAAVGALVLDRTDGGFATSYDTATGQSVGGTGGQPAAGGIDLALTRWFCCGRRGIHFTYWGLYPATNTTTALGNDTVGLLSSNFDFSGLDYSNGSTSGSISDWFDDAAAHEVRQRNEYHSLELSYLGNEGFAPWGSDMPGLGYGWLMGIRYFRFSDDFSFFSDDVDTEFTGDTDEVSYDVRTQNDLLGFQVGGGVSRRVWRKVSLYGLAKAGVYGVNARQEQFIGGGNGLALVGSGPFAGEVYQVSSTSVDMAMLGQLDLGSHWQFAPQWSAQLGYRIVGISGVALVEDQIPADFINLAGSRQVDTDGSVILHGAYIGATFAF